MVGKAMAMFLFLGFFGGAIVLVLYIFYGISMAAYSFLGLYTHVGVFVPILIHVSKRGLNNGVIRHLIIIVMLQYILTSSTSSPCQDNVSHVGGVRFGSAWTFLKETSYFPISNVFRINSPFSTFWR